MTLYRYVKKTLPLPVGRARRLPPKALSVIFVALGVLFLINAAYPIVSYQLFVSPRFSRSFVSPTAESAIAQSFGSAGNQPSVENGVLGQEIDLLDLTKASNWFPQSDVVFDESEASSYTLSIPRLGIKEAWVIVGGEDLKKSLIQFPGTAVPGRFGNSVIFGHSVLPQFFNPKNYMTIFSTLPAMKIKDEINIDYNQIHYRYLTEQMIEVSPNDVSILAQRYDDSYLTLITCVPPGTYLKRLIIRARLVKM